MGQPGSITAKFRVFAVKSLCLVSASAGALVSQAPKVALADDDHRGSTAGVKAPIAEILQCPLAFEGVHLLKSVS